MDIQRGSGAHAAVARIRAGGSILGDGIILDFVHDTRGRLGWSPRGCPAHRVRMSREEAVTLVTELARALGGLQ